MMNPMLHAAMASRGSASSPSFSTMAFLPPLCAATPPPFWRSVATAAARATEPAPWRPRDAARQVESRVVGLGSALRCGGGEAVPEEGKRTYCFRAVSRVSPMPLEHPTTSCPLSAVTGYDTSPEIARAVEAACAARLRTLGARGRGFVCETAELAMLPRAPKGCDCSGQMFFTISGKTRRMV